MQIVRFEDESLAPHCAVCESPLRPRGKQKFTSYLCTRCNEEWGGQIDEEWLRFLVNQERTRRREKWRLVPDEQELTPDEKDMLFEMFQ